MRKLKLLMASLIFIVGGSNSVYARTDVTSTYLTDAALENETANWALVSNGGNHVWDGTNKYRESWHNTFTLTQTTAALPAGYYQLSVQAAVEGGNSTTISLQATSGENSSVAVYPKYSTHSSFADMAAWWAADASHTGNRDLNRIFTTVYVEEGQTLTATFKQTANNQWFVYGQMQLHKLTDAEGRYAQIFEAAYNPLTNLDMASGRFKQRFENYNGGDVSGLTGKKLNKTISSLPKGRYNVTLNGGASYAKNDGVSGGGTGDNKTTFFANNASTNVTVVERTNIGNGDFTDYTASNALVSDGNLEVGFNNIASGANWFVGSIKYIEYVDPYISELVKGSFTSGNTMKAGEWYSYSVPTDGDYTLSATEGIVYAVADCLNSEATAATSTVALPAGTVYFKSATSQALTITYVEPVVANGEYYLYNETTKKFLSRGANYGSRTTIDIYGIPVTWNNYTKYLQFKDTPSLYIFFDNTPTNSWTYSDGGTNREYRYFAFEAVEGGYILKDNNNTACIWTEDNAIVKPTAIANKANAIVWTLKTKAEHDAIVAAYPTENKAAVITAAGIETTAGDFETWLSTNRAAKDKTSSVGTAKFTGAIGSWTWAGVRGQDKQPAYGTDWCEIFQATGDFSQEITGLSKGIYKVTVNAFERETGYATCNTLGAEGYEITTAYFEANSQKVQLKSWYSDKTGESNPNTTDEAATAFNNDKYRNEVYCYVGDDGTLTLKLAKPSYASGSWVLFNNVTLTYYDNNVSDEDATAILSEAATQLDKPMKHSLYAALNTAKMTFDGAPTVPNYSALRTAIDNTTTSVTSYANMYTNYLEPLNTYYATTNFVQSDAYTTYLGYKAAYDNYKQDGAADVENATANSLNITKGGGTNYTSTYSLMMLPNWKIGETTALTNGSGFYVNTWSTENNGSGDAADFANPFFEYWVGSGSLAETTITGTLTGLTANTAYDVTANVRVQGSSKVAGSITMEVVGGVSVDVTAGNQIGETDRYIKSYTATGVTDASGNLELKFNVAANSNISWLSFRDVNYAESDAAISNDFTDLIEAINTAKDHTLGFENGEYAPYNNLSGLEAIAAAEAFDNTRYYIPTVISNAVTALNNASWNVNSDDLDCVYNGNFSSDKDWGLTGWNRTNGWGQQRDDVDATSASTNYGYYNQPGSLQYGNAGYYTMPLKANTVYQLSFKYASWENNSNGGVTVSVLNGDNGMAALAFEENGKKYNESGAFVTKSFVFATGAAGNYVLTLANSGNTVMTDVSITKAASQVLEFADGSVPAYAPGTYPTVKISRTLTAGRWATAVYPFAVSGVDNIAVFDSYEDGTLGFQSEGVTSSVANEPFLMRSTAGTSEISLSDVTVLAAAATDVVKGDASLKGVYTTTTVEAGDNVKNYVLSNNVIYPIGATAATVNPYRAYIQLNTIEGARALRFTIDGEDTQSIEGINVADSENGVVYNLQGQRVVNAQKGLFIQDGKKVVRK